MPLQRAYFHAVGRGCTSAPDSRDRTGDQGSGSVRCLQLSDVQAMLPRGWACVEGPDSLLDL